MKYYIRTFGCQMNQHDSEFIEGMLEKLNYKSAEKVDEADIVVVNTCSIRDTAEKKILGFIDSLKLIKRINPALKVVVVGCMVSNAQQVERLVKKRGHINLILGTRSLNKLPYYLEKIRENEKTIVDNDLSIDVPEDRLYKRPDFYRSFLTIMYGCDNFCSYCVVPYVRGREKSRSLDDIVQEAKSLAADGVKEITLLGQNVNSYGKGLKEKTDFADVLQAVSSIDGIERIRYMTSHPKDFTDRIINTIENLPKVCRHFHLPFQSGSSRILEKMNRHYNREYYLDLMKKIKERFPQATLTTDIIVGFPGESEDDFQDTLNLLQEIEFDLAYTFIYSPRQGTPGAEMSGQIPLSVKKQRLNALMDVQNEISLKKNKAMIGKKYSLLGEGASRTRPEVQSGRTEGNKLVHFKSQDDLTGKFINVEITDANTWSLRGRLL